MDEAVRVCIREHEREHQSHRHAATHRIQRDPLLSRYATKPAPWPPRWPGVNSALSSKRQWRCSSGEAGGMGVPVCRCRLSANKACAGLREEAMNCRLSTRNGPAIVFVPESAGYIWQRLSDCAALTTRFGSAVSIQRGRHAAV